MKTVKQLHYAWFIAAASMLIAGAGSGIFVSTLGVFIKPVCDQFGFSRAAFSLYSSIYFIINVCMMPVYGNLIQKYSYRKIALLSSLICSGCLLGYSFSNSLLMFYFFAFLSGLFVNGLNIMAIGILINRWFIDSRGLASGLAFSGTGILAAVTQPLCTWLISRFGISTAYQFLAALELLLTVPVLIVIIRDHPEDAGLTPYIKIESPNNTSFVPTSSSGFTRSEAMKMPAFWLLFASAAGITICQAGANSNTVAILNDIGYTAAYAARISSCYMIMLTTFKILMGKVFDRVGSLTGSLIIGSCCVLFPLTALFIRFPGMPWLYAFFLAVAGSGASVMVSVLAGDYFGRKDYARIYSILALGPQLGAVFSSPMLGYIYDTTGGYRTAWFLIIGLGVLVCCFLYCAYHGVKGFSHKSCYHA